MAWPTTVYLSDELNQQTDGNVYVYIPLAFGEHTRMWIKVDGTLLPVANVTRA